VQLSGPKRWLLIPPTEWRAMYLYPALSPHYHQSQIDMDEPDNMAAFARFHNVSVFEAILVPGDVLYVPRTLQHRRRDAATLRSLSCSLSLSHSDLDTTLVQHSGFIVSRASTSRSRCRS